MKKILSFLTAAIIAATSAQAVSITWGSGAMKAAKNADGEWDTTSAKKAVTAVYLIVDKVSYEKYVDGSAVDREGIYNDWTTLAEKAKRSSGAVTSNNGGSANWEDATGVSGTETVYALVLYTYSHESYGDFYITAASNVHLNDLNEVEGVTGSLATSVGAWTPVPVPEPTTVALLALGLAAVGLKRKVA